MDSGTPRIDGLADVAPVLLVLLDAANNTVIDVNAYGLDLLGYDRDDIIGAHLRSLVPEFDPAGRKLVGSRHLVERRVRDGDGNFINFSFSLRPYPGFPDVVIAAGHPVDDLTHADSSLADILQLAELTDDIFLVTDKSGRLRYWNRAASEVHQISDLEGARPEDFLHESDTGYRELLKAYSNDDHRASARTLARGPNGEAIHLAVQTVYDPVTERWYSVERDVRALVAQEQKLEALAADLARRAATDDLTGVANRSEMYRLIDHATTQPATFGVLMMDMDDFKSVNDTLGHAAGDELLKIVARRLETVAGQSGTVGRLGGDEFLLLLPAVDDAGAAMIAAQLVETIGAPFAISGRSIIRSCSIGVALSQPGDDVEAVLLRADHAAYEAKHAGRSRFKVFSGSNEGWPVEPGIERVDSLAPFERRGQP